MKIFLLMIISIFLLGCDGDDEEFQLSMNFTEPYLLADFNLSDDYDYWEIRRGSLSTGDNAYDVIARYDNDAYNSLDETQIQLIDEASSQSGFAAYCFPSYCPVYAVAIKGYQIAIIDTRSQLVELFGAIDTEAELAILMSHDQSYHAITNPITYELTEDGYLVVLDWDTTCQLSGRDLVKVHGDGTVEKIRKISSKKTNSCA